MQRTSEWKAVVMLLSQLDSFLATAPMDELLLPDTPHNRDLVLDAQLQQGDIRLPAFRRRAVTLRDDCVAVKRSTMVRYLIATITRSLRLQEELNHE